MVSSYRTFLRSKIHGATVTDANLYYEGSITIPPDLLEASDISEHEQVHVWNITNGSRIRTYVIKGLPSSRKIAINGAAARLIAPNDKVIIATFELLPSELISSHIPKIIFLDDNNSIKRCEPEKPFQVVI
jgi:aspartate 1-decarboxylase